MFKASNCRTTPEQKMRWSQRCRFAALATILLSVLANSAQAQFKDLARRVPGTANALVIVNVDKVHQSPLAVREGWEDEHAKAFDAGLTIISPRASHFILASQIDFEFVHPLWEVFVADFNELRSMAEIAEDHGGKVDTVAGAPVIVLPIDAYVVKFGYRTLGGITPGIRQNVARWVRDCQSESSMTLSPYLQQAVGYADEVGTEIIIALDLEDALIPDVVRERVRASSALAGEQVDIDRLTEVICSVKGVMLGIRIGERLSGKMNVDFGLDASMMADYAQPMLLAMLADAGATIDDLDYWDAAVSGKRVSIEGHLSNSAFRRVLSLVDAPTTPLRVVAESRVPEGPTEASLKGQASLAYFKSVTSLLEDLRAETRDAKTIGEVGLWLDKYARKIDYLPILNVDKELLDYGEYVCLHMRRASGALKAAGIRKAAREVSVYPTYVAYGRYGAYYGEYGYPWAYIGDMYAEMKNVEGARRVVRAQEKATGASSAVAIMMQVAQVTAKVRRTMTERYQIEF